MSYLFLAVQIYDILYIHLREDQYRYAIVNGTIAELRYRAAVYNSRRENFTFSCRFWLKTVCV